MATIRGGEVPDALITHRILLLSEVPEKFAALTHAERLGVVKAVVEKVA